MSDETQPTQPPMKFNKSSEVLTTEEWKDCAEKLWALLDDIDTASDMFKPPKNNFYNYVMLKAEARHIHITSDGYNLFPVRAAQIPVGDKKELVDETPTTQSNPLTEETGKDSEDSVLGFLHQTAQFLDDKGEREFALKYLEAAFLLYCAWSPEYIPTRQPDGSVTWREQDSGACAGEAPVDKDL